jgi:hypothetical protein
MNHEQAKEILTLYRPGTADADDAYFCEARTLCEIDPGLKLWFDEHRAAHLALRARFKQIPVPEGLKEQILAERKIHTTPVWRRPLVVLAAVAAFAVLLGLASLWLPRREVTAFQHYRTRMTSTARRTYGMELETASLDRIRSFFEQQHATADYVLPAALQQKAQAIGCARLHWQGQTVSMICFKSGRPLPPDQPSDVWLLVAQPGAMPGAPASSTPVLAEVNGAWTASWKDGNAVYILIAEGNEEFLHQYL